MQTTKRTPTRARVIARGVVQGVGFRPYVYKLARDYGLAGWVLNSTEGVVIEVEGERVEDFVADLPRKAPPLARVERLAVTMLPPVGYVDFKIEASDDAQMGVALVSPDICVCDDCLREMRDPANRRHRYAFTNCTNCGPRFTIVEAIPYDRRNTTMRAFQMCPQCQAEYDDPGDRRFHAQPNACPACGPQVSLVARDTTVSGDAAIEEAKRRLRAGEILAVKGLGGFHLACDAGNDAVVRALRLRKGRAEKPFAVMVPDLDVAAELCEVSPDEARLLASPQRPIVLLKKRVGQSGVVEAVAPRNRNLGVMLPYTPLHYLLFSGGGPRVLVMTSGNFSEEPIVTGNDEAQTRLAPLADAFLLHDREISVRCDDSVTRVFEGHEALIRRSRGYAPYPIRLRSGVRQVLACGGELKNTFCLTRDEYAFVSHHIGDLENAETLASFEEGVEHFKRLFHCRPEVAAYDLHPEYLSTKYALGLVDKGEFPPERLVGVQHHHAHVASCMADNALEGTVIGVALDGTGYGTDGTLWGGEFLIASYERFERACYLLPVPLPGGAAAIRAPYRAALSYAYAALGELEPALSLLRADMRNAGLPSADGQAGRLSDTDVAVLSRQVRGQLNSPLTSSFGRLFDAVSALLGLRHVISYEGQAAIELEMAADPREEGAYPFPLVERDGVPVLDHRPLIRAVLADRRAGLDIPTVSGRFHNAVAGAIVEACLRLRSESGLDRVVLSGGVFQNLLLLARTTAGLRARGFAVFTHHQVPCNDGGLSLGQAMVADAVMRQHDA